MFSNYTIKPNNGLGDIEFGIDMDAFVEKYGEPEELDNIDEDEDLHTSILHYWKKGFSLFFVGLTNPVLSGIEVDHLDTTLYDEKIIGKTKEEIIKLMADNGNVDYSEGDEEFVSDEDSDLRVSFDESMMDFFFKENQLVFMNFGVYIDEDGSLVKVN